MIKIPFEVARDIAYFELFKVLTPLNERAEKGEYISREEKMLPLRNYENRSEEIFKEGLSKTELENILEDFKTNPISKKSCSTIEKWNFMVQEIELLLKDDYDEKSYIIRLVKSYGYNKKQAELIVQQAIDNIFDSKDISIYDRANEICIELAS